MQDVIAGIETVIPFHGYNRITGEDRTGARISIKRISTGFWWDGGSWVSDVQYNDMTHISDGAHEYLMTFSDAGDYLLLFTGSDGYMVGGSDVITVYPDDRLQEDDVEAALRGEGAKEGTVTVQVGGLSCADADVWVTSDSGGLQVVAGTLQTNSNGQVTFWLDEEATYYLWVQKDGFNFDNPTEIEW